MKLSEHFDSSEFECRDGCGEDFSVDPALIVLLEAVREHFGTPITVTSGYRCKAHNDSLGSTDASQHRKATAADIIVGLVKPRNVASYIDSIMPRSGGLGRYKTFTHADVRKRKARWGKD